MELVASGASFEDIQQAGGWASLSVQRTNYTKVPPYKPIAILAGFTQSEEYCIPRNFINPLKITFLEPLVADLLGDLAIRVERCKALNCSVGKRLQDSAGEEFGRVVEWLCKIFLQGLPCLFHKFPGSQIFLLLPL